MAQQKRGTIMLRMPDMQQLLEAVVLQVCGSSHPRAALALVPMP